MGLNSLHVCFPSSLRLLVDVRSAQESFYRQRPDLQASTEEELLVFNYMCSQTESLENCRLRDLSLFAVTKEDELIGAFYFYAFHRGDGSKTFVCVVGGVFHRFFSCFFRSGLCRQSVTVAASAKAVTRS